MANVNFFPKWAFERPLPKPFDCFSGRDAVFKSVSSKYCIQPRKQATLHSATLQAVFTYMDLENPPAGKAEEELGAIGSQANNFTIAEYPSRTGLLHVVVYNRMTGKFIAGKYEKPLDLDSKPEPYQFKKDEDSGSALYFALMPALLSDDEFNEKYQELKQHRDDGFPDLPKAAETAALLCDNVYRRIRYGDSLPIGNVKVDTPANGVIQRLTPLNIQKGVYAPTEIIQGTFQVLKGGHHYTSSAVSIPKEDFVDKYILSNSRTLTPQEESTVPVLEDWYVIPKEIQRICEHAKLTTDSKQPMRNFMLRGPAGTGKTEGAKAIAAGLHLPYRCITCSANTEIFDLLGQILPDVDEKQLSLVGELPSFQDITLDPATAYEKLTGTYDEKVSENTVYEELIHHISEEMKQKQAAASNSQQFRYVDTPLVEAIRNGYLVEIQEPTVIANPGVLVGLNSLTLSRCAAQFNNILEDIYIEARMCEEYPGTFKQGIQLNNLRMSELIPSVQEQIDCGYQPFSIMSNLILSYCRTGNINNRTNYSGEYTDTLSDCMDYIDDALIASQGKERFRASNYLLIICWNHIQPMVEQTRESLKKQDSTQVGDALEELLRKESSSGAPLPIGKNGGIPKNIPGPTGKSKTPMACDLSGLDPNYRQDIITQAEKVLQEEGGRIELAKTTAILDGNNPGITYASQYAGSGYEDAANDLARILNDVATEKAQSDYEQELTDDLQKSADEIHYGNAHAGIHVTIHRINPVSDFFIKSYQTVASPLLQTSKRLQSSILPLLKEEAEGGKQKNLLFGKRLDMRALHRKDGGIFTRTKLPDEEQKLSVGLLVDESGSMSWGDRITHARKTAIVLYDFCTSLGIPITIYGHSTDSKGVALYSYAEFDSLDASDRYRLMDMSARNGNRDGAALRYVAEHLAKRPESQKLLIIISDGQPADCGYSGTEAEADLRGIKNEYRKRGIVLFAAAIGDDKENIRRIYQDGFLDITKLEDLPKNMTQLVKQYLK